MFLRSSGCIFDSGSINDAYLVEERASGIRIRESCEMYVISIDLIDTFVVLFPSETVRECRSQL